MNFQDIIQKLNQYWARQGCALAQPYGPEKASAEFSPAVFFGALRPGPSAFACVEACRRPAGPARQYQYQVFMKPPAPDMQRVCAGAFRAAGLDLAEHDLRWIPEDWSSPALGASGPGWELRLDGQPFARFVYLQAVASRPLDGPAALLTCGLERLAMAAQGKRDVMQLRWTDRLTYGDVHGGAHEQFSRYDLEEADAQGLRALFSVCEREVPRLASAGCWLPAFDLLLKASYSMDLLAARRSLSADDKPAMVKRLAAMAGRCADACAAKGGRHG